MNIFFRIFFKPKYFWVLSWDLELGFFVFSIQTFLSKPKDPRKTKPQTQIQTQEPKETKFQTQTQNLTKLKRNRLNT